MSMSAPEPPQNTEPSQSTWDDAAVGERYAQLQAENPGIVDYPVDARRHTFAERVSVAGDAVGTWLRRHWLALINGALITYLGVAVLNPFAYMLGWDGLASTVFRTYRFFCDELPTHSFFIGGYQICLCARCLAIYSSLLLGGLLLAYLRKRRPVKALAVWTWVLLALPMALDGGTQFFGWRESNNALRVLTGLLFGLGTAWLTLPRMNATAEAADDEPRPAYAYAPQGQ
ncbi:MAG TPA: DUF2085 domain-containing protein [Ktedonobacterales bacterium]